MYEQTNTMMETKTTFQIPQLLDGDDFTSEDLADDMEGLRLSFTRIKIPGGGHLQFEIPSGNPDVPDYAPYLEGVILYSHNSNAYWPEGSEYDDDQPPLCQSFDGKVAEHGERYSPLNFKVAYGTSHQIGFAVTEKPVEISLHDVDGMNAPERYQLFVHRFVGDDRIRHVIVSVEVPPIRESDTPVHLEQIAVSTLIAGQGIILFQVRHLLQLFIET